MKTALLILGVLALLMGLLWIGQGTGYIHWPASSYMIDQRPWALRGAVLAVVGLVLILATKKLGSLMSALDPKADSSRASAFDTELTSPQSLFSVGGYRSTAL
jgi:hypothetical protein